MNRPRKRALAGRFLALLLGSLSVQSVASAPAAAEKAYPTDEARRDPTLVAVRAQLLAAIRKRDVEGVLKHMSPDVKLSLGGDGGQAEFRRMMSRTPALWKSFEWALRNGGRFGGGGEWFAAPYTAEARLGKVEPFDALIVVARRAPLRAGPSARAKVVGWLSYDIVEMLSPPGARGETWRKVRVQGGKVGWVEKRVTRSPIDYRVVFRNVGGEWIVVSFLSGD